MTMTRREFSITEESSKSSEDISKKPDNTAFKQQRLAAWQPVYEPKSVLPMFFIVGILFIPLGSIFLVSSNNVWEVSIDYTNCVDISSGSQCSSNAPNVSCTCQETLTVDSDVTGPVFVYYRLSNFYQNHRRYVKSRDDNQLLGSNVDSLSDDCKPFKEDANGKLIAPCGAIANSLFNDTFEVSGVTISRKNIAWNSDHDVKFNNPEPVDNLVEAFKDFEKPPYWSQRVEELDTSDSDNNGYKNEALEVWMRTSAFPTFRKLYGRLDNGLSQGTYTIDISYNFPVVGFDGTKSIVFSTVSFLGGKNSFIGICYIVVGALSLLTGLVLLIANKYRPN